MSTVYKSQYTGNQIDEILGKADNIVPIVPNTAEQTNVNLDTIKIGDTPYNIPKGTTVIPNVPLTSAFPLRTLEIDGVIYAPSSLVTANPQEDATEELKKLKVNDTIYFIPEGSTTPIEGTVVEANPDGEPSDSLIKIKIGDIIYNITNGTEVIGNPSDITSASTLKNLKIGTKYYTITQPTHISANPPTAGTVDLTKLRVGTVTYSIPPSVSANPDSGGSETLKKLKIGSVIYNVPQTLDLEINPAPETTTVDAGIMKSLRKGILEYSTLPKSYNRTINGIGALGELYVWSMSQGIIDVTSQDSVPTTLQIEDCIMLIAKRKTTTTSLSISGSGFVSILLSDTYRMILFTSNGQITFS